MTNSPTDKNVMLDLGAYSGSDSEQFSCSVPTEIGAVKFVEISHYKGEVAISRADRTAFEDPRS